MRIVGKKAYFDFTAQRVVSTNKSYYIFFENNRYVDDFVIKFFMRDIYNQQIPEITITSQCVSISKETGIYIEGVG